MVEVATARIGWIPSRQTADDRTERRRIAAETGAPDRIRADGCGIDERFDCADADVFESFDEEAAPNSLAAHPMQRDRRPLGYFRIASADSFLKQ